MIKNLKSKFLICLFLLVTVFSVTSSCFAVIACPCPIIEAPFTIEEAMESVAYDTICSNKPAMASFDITKHKYIILAGSGNSWSVRFLLAENVSYGIFKYNSTYKNYYLYLYDSSGNQLTYTYHSMPYENGKFTINSGSGSSFAIYDSFSLTQQLNFPVYSEQMDLWVEPVKDISFDYELVGVKRRQVKLTINNLDSSLKMYGYVGLHETFAIGDTLDLNANIDKLRLMSTSSDNSDLYCYLSEGEEVNYYIVDDNNVILDVGYISEMAKGDYLYGFEVNNGIDFVFLRDGQVYWSNNLIFKYNTNNSNTLQNNDIVSMGEYSYIATNKTVASGTYTGYVYNSSGELLAQANCDYSNDLSSLLIKVDTSYYENKVGLNKSCYWLQTIYLLGNNTDGTSIDFSNYSVRWSIPTWVVLDSLEVNSSSYDKYFGTLTGFTSTGVLSMFNLKIYELIKDHTKSFNITLQVYDDNDTLVLTHVINSDDIISKQVSSEENNVDKGDYDILDNPGYTGGSNNSSDIGNIQNWTADDYLNLMSTDNFVWEFFKAILGNLPWWITTPLTILIFGVVIITIIRFARGA